jgi:hypothetical protein
VLTDFTIYCHKYSWDENTVEIQDRNFFNFDSQPTLEETLIINDYILDIGKLEYNFDVTDETSTGYYLTPSELSFVCGGLIGDRYLQSFFEFYTDEIYMKYLIEILYLGTLIWKGIINPGSFEIGFSPSPDSEQIKFTAFGLEKEFSDYFVNQTLENPLTLGVAHDDNLNIWAGDILSVLKAEFAPTSSIINFACESGLEDWKVANTPVIKRVNKNSLVRFNAVRNTYVLIKAGIERIVDMQENKFDWLKKTLTAMGWVFYFKGDTFKLRNRLPTGNSLVGLDKENILDYKVTKQFHSIGFDYIIIDDGDFKLNTYWNQFTDLGHYYQFYAFSNNQFENILYNYPFNDYQPIEDNGIRDFATFKVGDKIFYTYAEDEWTKDITYGKIAATTDNGQLIILDNGNKYRHRAINNKRLLKLDCGNCEVVDVTFTGNATKGYEAFLPYTSPIPTPSYMYQAKGQHYGNQMFKRSGNTYTTYQDYVYTNQMQNNMSKYLNDKSIRRVNVRYKGLLFDYLESSFAITGIDNLVTGTYDLKSISFDLKSKETSLELQQALYYQI